MRIDPKRIDKMLAVPMPKKLKEMQSYCGFLSSITLYSSNQLSHYHGILAELTSNKKGFKFQVLPKHIDAFEHTKRILTQEPLFLNFPNQYSPKVLFVDSSDILLGAVLLQVDFPQIQATDSPCEYDVNEMLRSFSGRIRFPSICTQPAPFFPLPTRVKAGSSFFESLSALCIDCLLYTSPSPRDRQKSRMPSSA